MSGTLDLDTSALVKLYINEPGSRWVQAHGESAESILMSPLQETEPRNAVFAASGRNVINRATMRQVLQHIETDLSEGAFTRRQPDWPLVWQRANQLAEAHTPRVLCRALDVPHVGHCRNHRL